MGRSTPVKLALQGLVPAAALALFWLSPAAGCGGGSSGTSRVRPDGGTTCSQGTASCAAGEACNNGDCIKLCGADGGCAAGTFCEAGDGGDPARNVCVPTVPIACASSFDCPLPQACRQGFCIAQELRADGGQQACLIQGTNDGCATEALCFQTDQTHNACYGMPACAQDGTCPVGTFGSVCNDLPDGGRLYPDKQRVCLFSYCVTNDNCNSAFKCFHPVPGQPLGQCSDGTAGQPCYTSADCFNSTVCLGSSSDGGVSDAGDGGSTFGRCQ